MKKTNQSTSGTSYHGIEIKVNPDTIFEVLGEPSWVGRCSEEKVWFQWAMETETGHVFTVYDYKRPRNAWNMDTIRLHIGAHSKEVSIEAFLELNEAIEKEVSHASAN